MLTVIIALSLLIFWVFFAWWKDIDVVIIIIIAGAILLFSSMLALTDPKYNEQPIIEETPLLSIAEENGESVYLLVSKNKEYIYKIHESSEKYGIEEENICVKSGDNIKMFEDENRETAVLQRHVYKPEWTLYSLPVGDEKEEYVFFVPKGSVEE